MLAGCCFAVMRWRRPQAETFFWVNSAAILLWGGCIFGWVPVSILTAVPLLNRVGHTYNDFSYLLVIHLTIQSAYGFKWLAAEENSRRVTAGFVLLAGVCLALNLLAPHPLQPAERNYFACVEIGAFGAPLLFVYLKSRYRRLPALGWAGIVILGFIALHRFGLYNFGNDYILMRPGARAVLNAPSQAVDTIKADRSGPFRTVGLDQNFTGDYAAVYGLEDIRSCAPLSNGELIRLLQKFPGVDFSSGWEFLLAEPVKAQPLLNLLNVKYMLAAPGVRVPAGQAFRVTARSDFGVMENLEVWPRAFFSDKVYSLASTDDFIRHLLNQGSQPFIAVTGAELEKQPNLQSLLATKQATVSPATKYVLSPNATEFDVHAPAAGVVCLTEGQAQDFTAEANREPKAVLTVNRAFKGIYLERAGDYHVKFTYRPRHWRLACACFWIAISAVVVLVLIKLIRSHGTPKIAPAPD